MIVSIILLILGIVILIKGADLFIDSGSAIAKIFKMSEILIGLTFVCIGTSLPELIISSVGAAKGSSGLVIGNIIGTNIFNMCVILGMICIVHPIKLLRETVRKDMYMSLLSSIILLVVLLDVFLGGATTNYISRTDGIILLLFFAIFMYYTLYEFGEYIKERDSKKDPKEVKKREKIILTKKDVQDIFKNIIIALISIGMIYLGAKLVVDNGVIIAKILKISETFIAIGIIAVGTSLPEITTTIAAVKKKRVNIAIGNLIGGNMFNTLFVLGTAATINPLKLPTEALFVDCIVYIFICFVMVMFTRKKQEISRVEGMTLISTYMFYIAYVIYRK